MSVQRIYEALKSYRMTNFVCEDNEHEPLPLVDHMCDTDDTSSGHQELHKLAVHIHAELTQ